MTVVLAPAKVLVTGASGFIALHIVKDLLLKGYSVRGTVRSERKGKYILGLLDAKANFEHVIVPDMEVPNAYDEAVKGVDAVLHTASIVKAETGHPDAIIKPAIGGTLGILESVKRFGPTVKRVVITSSIVAVGFGAVDESHWNEYAVDTTEKQGVETNGQLKYAASKVLAERAAWDFVGKNKKEIGFDIVTLCPTWVWGPMLQDGSTPDSINSSMYAMLSGVDKESPKQGDTLLNQTGNAIDVRDVASIHVDVLAAEGASNQRFITSAHAYSWQDIYDALNKSPAFENVPVGQPGSGRKASYAPISSQKILGVLGKSHAEYFRPFEVTVRDTLADARKRGWIPTGRVF